MKKLKTDWNNVPVPLVETIKMMKKVIVEMFNLLHDNMNDFKTLYHIQHSNQVYLQEVIQEQG